MSWSIKKAVKALRKGTHGRHYLAERVNLSPSALYYRAFPERLKREPGRKRSRKSNGKRSNRTKSASAPVTTLREYVAEIRAENERAAQALRDRLARVEARAVTLLKSAVA